MLRPYVTSIHFCKFTCSLRTRSWVKCYLPLRPFLIASQKHPCGILVQRSVVVASRSVDSCLELWTCSALGDTPNGAVRRPDWVSFPLSFAGERTLERWAKITSLELECRCASIRTARHRLTTRQVRSWQAPRRVFPKECESTDRPAATVLSIAPGTPPWLLRSASIIR
jgi:hypothetical protein